MEDDRDGLSIRKRDLNRYISPSARFSRRTDLRIQRRNSAIGQVAVQGTHDSLHAVFGLGEFVDYDSFQDKALVHWIYAWVKV